MLAPLAVLTLLMMLTELAHAKECVYLDLVCVHAGVGDQDLDVLQPLGLVHSDLLVQQETWR